MRTSLTNRAVQCAGWFGLAYLGYWLALGVDRVLVQGIVLPLLGIPLTDWSVTPWRLTLSNTLPEAGRDGFALAIVLPLVLEIGVLALLARWGAGIRPASLRMATHYAGLWIVLLLAGQGALFAVWGRLRVGQFHLRLNALSHLPLRIAVTVAAFLLLLFIGGTYARRFVGESRGFIRPDQGRTWLSTSLFVLPVLGILWGAYGSALQFFGRRAMAFLLVPAAFCLLLALAGLWRRPKTISQTSLGASGALAALGLSAVLYAGLQQAPRWQLRLADRHLRNFASAHYQILVDEKTYAQEFVEAFAAERERALAAQAARLNLPLDSVRLRVVLYSDLASFRAATGSERTYQVDGTTVRAALGGYIQPLDPAADAAALLHAAWGRPGTPRVGEWVARWLAGEWRARDLAEAAAQIRSEVGHYSLAALLDTTPEGRVSPLVQQPLGALWVASAFDLGGIETLHRLYTKVNKPDVSNLAAQLGLTPAQLEQDWRQRATRLASGHRAEPPPQRSLDASFFFRGISFSHEGWGGRRGGYVSPQAEEELRRLRAMGANALAVVPYGFLRDAQGTTISYTWTDETDEELTHALHVAHSLGMKVMLKPQLWVGGGEFTGAIRFDDPAARAAWLRSYREFILHYARLAELEQFDLLAIGTELEGVTRYADDWRRLIAEVRRVYRGPLTYAANWGREFESLSFWDALDYIGVNNYYPLAQTPSERVEDLLPGARQLCAKLEAVSQRWRKPILFTEVGYPSVRGAAAQPWAEDDARGINLAEQAAAYEATFRAFAGQPWFRGMFWWKWPSSGRGGGPQDFSYTPRGKPAAEVLRLWFTRLADSRKAVEANAP